MRRREFITLLGGTAATWPLSVRAQQPAMPVIGFLHHAWPDQFAILGVAFRQGLKEAGFVEGKNVAVEYRWAEDQHDRLPTMAADLVRRQVAVIVVNTPSMAAVKAATATIPIVFVSADDPVAAGLAASFNRPGGNATGVYFLITALEGKRLELLRELVPKAPLIAALVNPNFPSAESQSREMQEAARALGFPLLIVRASTESELDAAFATLIRERRVLLFPARADRRVRGLTRATHDLSSARGRRRRRVDELWNQRARRLSPGRHLRRPHSQGGEAGRSTGPAIGEGRAGHQHEDSQGARRDLSALAARPRRRGDRMM
jgi:ABC-type uncharacterized transport system substrate-binding protein